jgi:hypothetical protein
MKSTQAHRLKKRNNRNGTTNESGLFSFEYYNYLCWSRRPQNFQPEMHAEPPETLSASKWSAAAAATTTATANHANSPPEVKEVRRGTPGVNSSPRMAHSSPPEEKNLGFPFSENGPSAVQGHAATSPFSDLGEWEDRGVTTPNDWSALRYSQAY